MTVTLQSRPIAETHEQTLELALRHAQREGSFALATHTMALDQTPDALAFLAAGGSAGAVGTYWSQGRDGLTFAGVGAAREVSASGPERFTRINAACGQVRDALVGNEPGTPFPMFCGFAFDDRPSHSGTWRDFPNSRLVVPSALLQIGESGALLRLTKTVYPHDALQDLVARSDAELQRCRQWLAARHPAPTTPHVAGTLALPDRQSWESSVATAVAKIQQGSVDKVVLAREEVLLADSTWLPIRTLSQLADANPTATVFGVQSGESWFVGATPERLVRLHDGQVEVSCLAGSIAIGGSAASDQRQAERLLASAKDREEHEIVVRSTISALRDVCERVTRVTPSPRVVAARSVLHLETPLLGTLAASGNILDLVARLHPTPAVGGFPRDRALEIIRELEAFDRGWYAGPVGWVDVDGSGDFAVALRSALLAGRTASLFAGSGIVRNSQPDAEFAETRLKLAPMLSALGHA